jgi:glutaryl-CoA dehydrogenase
MAFQCDDPLGLESEFDDDARAILYTARAYAQEKLVPRMVSAAREEGFDRDVIAEMGELGRAQTGLPAFSQ